MQKILEIANYNHRRKSGKVPKISAPPIIQRAEEISAPLAPFVHYAVINHTTYENACYDELQFPEWKHVSYLLRPRAAKESF